MTDWDTTDNKTGEKMAKISKDGYERKAEYAARRMEANAENKNLTPAQHAALRDLAAARHQLHCGIDRLIKSAETGIDDTIIEAIGKINKSGLPNLKLPHQLGPDAFDIDCFQDPLFDVPEDADEYAGEYERIHEQWSAVHSAIDNYLRKTDSENKTFYAPTGMSRE